MDLCFCFSGSLSVLVNWCPLEEICIHKGLKQGGHLVPFLFLLVAEGLNSSLNKVVSMSILQGFKVDLVGLEVSHF